MYHAYQRSTARSERARRSDRRHVTFSLPPNSPRNDQTTSSQPQVASSLPPDFRLNAPIPDADDATMVRTGAVHHRSLQPRFHVEEFNSNTSIDEEQRIHPPLTHPVPDDDNRRRNSIETTDRCDNEVLTATQAPPTQLTHQQTQGSVITQEDLKTLEILDHDENKDEFSENSIPLDVASPLNNYSATRVFPCDACLVVHHGPNESFSTEETTSAPMDRQVFACNSRHVEAKPESLGLEAIARTEVLDEPSVNSRIHLKERVSDNVGLSSPKESFSLQQDDESRAEEQESPVDLESKQHQGHEPASQENESREALLSSQEKLLHALVADHHPKDGNKHEEGLDLESQQPFPEEKSNAIVFDRNIISEEETDSDPREGSVFPTPLFQSPSLNNQVDRNVEVLDEGFMRDLQHLRHFLELYPDAISRIQRISMNNGCLETNMTACQAKNDAPSQERRAPRIEVNIHQEAGKHKEHHLDLSQQKCPTSAIPHDNCEDQSPHCLKKDPPCQPWQDPPFINKADPPLSVITDTLHNGRAEIEDMLALPLMHFQHLLQAPPSQKEDPPCRKWNEPPFVSKKDPPTASESVRSLQDDTSCSDSFSESSDDNSIESILEPIKKGFRRAEPNPASMQQDDATPAPMLQEDDTLAPTYQEEASPLPAQKASQATPSTYQHDNVLPKKIFSSPSPDGGLELIHKSTRNLYPLLEEMSLDQIYRKQEAAAQIRYPTVLDDFDPHSPFRGEVRFGGYAEQRPIPTADYNHDDCPRFLIEFEQRRRLNDTDTTRISAPSEKVPGAARVNGIDNIHWRNLVYVPEQMQPSHQQKPASAMQSTVPKQQVTGTVPNQDFRNQMRDIVVNDNLSDRSRNVIGFERQRQTTVAMQDSVSNQQVPGAVRVNGNSSHQQNLTAPAGLPSSHNAKAGAAPIPRRVSQVTAGTGGSDEDTVNAPSRVVAEVVDESQLLQELLSRLSQHVVRAENVSALTAESQDQVSYDVFLANAIIAGVDGDENGKKRIPWLLRLFGRARRQQTSTNDRSPVIQ